MAKFEHGSFDKDEVRVFDGSADEEAEESSNLPMLIVISLLVLAALGGLIWVAYNNGVAQGRTRSPAQVAAASNEAPAAQPGSGALPAPAKQIKIYQQPAGTNAEADKETHPPADPLTAKIAETSVTPPTPKTETKPAPAPAPVAKTIPAPSPVPAAPQIATKPPAKLVPAKPAPAPAPAAQPKPVTQSAPVAQPDPVRVVKSAAAPAVATAASGAFVLQIGAYKSESDANAAWRVYQAKHSTLLSGISSNVQKADLGDKGVWYRLRVGSFAQKEAAAALCDRLKAEGAACFPAK